jgi:hypothetical protein
MMIMMKWRDKLRAELVIIAAAIHRRTQSKTLVLVRLSEHLCSTTPADKRVS